MTIRNWTFKLRYIFLAKMRRYWNTTETWEMSDRTNIPPDGDGKEQIAIGLIYLSVYLNDEDYT